MLVKLWRVRFNPSHHYLNQSIGEQLIYNNFFFATLLHLFVALQKNVMNKFLLLAFAAFFLIACKKSDLTPPTIASVSVNNEAVEIINFSPGDTFVVRTSIDDNLELGQFKIDIHHDFDGHSHKNSTIRFAEIRIKDIEGTTFNLEEIFVVPIDAATGTYHGTIRALDKEGNTSEPRLFYFNVVRDNQPTISMNLPETISAGAFLQANGIISSVGDAELKTVFIRIVSTKTGDELLDETFTLEANTTSWNPFEDGNVNVEIPANDDEKIIFRIRVEDSNGNNTIFETEITIV